MGGKTQLKEGYLQPGLSIRELKDEGGPARIDWRKTCLF